MRFVVVAGLALTGCQLVTGAPDREVLAPTALVVIPKVKVPGSPPACKVVPDALLSPAFDPAITSYTVSAFDGQSLCLGVATNVNVSDDHGAVTGLSIITATSEKDVPCCDADLDVPASDYPITVQLNEGTDTEIEFVGESYVLEKLTPPLQCADDPHEPNDGSPTILATNETIHQDLSICPQGDIDNFEIHFAGTHTVDVTVTYSGTKLELNNVRGDDTHVTQTFPDAQGRVVFFVDGGITGPDPFHVGNYTLDVVLH